MIYLYLVRFKITVLHDSVLTPCNEQRPLKDKGFSISSLALDVQFLFTLKTTVSKRLEAELEDVPQAGCSSPEKIFVWCATFSAAVGLMISDGPAAQPLVPPAALV